MYKRINLMYEPIFIGKVMRKWMICSACLILFASLSIICVVDCTPLYGIKGYLGVGLGLGLAICVAASLAVVLLSYFRLFSAGLKSIVLGLTIPLIVYFYVNLLVGISHQYCR
jgi:hypothetical protein